MWSPKAFWTPLPLPSNPHLQAMSKTGSLTGEKEVECTYLAKLRELQSFFHFEGSLYLTKKILF